MEEENKLEKGLTNADTGRNPVEPSPDSALPQSSGLQEKGLLKIEMEEVSPAS